MAGRGFDSTARGFDSTARTFDSTTRGGFDSTSRHPPQPAKTNPFHQIRLREFGRERQFLRGADPAAVPKAYFTPSLKEICAQVIAATFEDQTDLDKEKEEEPRLSAELRHLITDQLRTDLPLEVCVPRVNVPEYWKARCEARWSVGQLAEYTGSMSLEPPAKGGWKRVFLERHHEEMLMSLERTTATEADEQALGKFCALCGTEIYAVRLSRQRCHFDINEMYQRLRHMEEFAVSFGVLNANVAVTPDMIGMKQQDALHIQKVLRASRCLTRLALPENEIDDDLCRAVVAGLVHNTTLRHLDLSHNRIGDVGAGAVGLVLLQQELVLETLDLGDNEIRVAGAAAIADGLAVTRHLHTLSLRLNRLGDEGGEMVILAAAENNKTLTSLDLSNNDLGMAAAQAIGRLATTTNGASKLTHLNVSCNAFGPECGQALRDAAQLSRTLLSLDTRRSGVGEDCEAAIAAEMQARVSREHLGHVARKQREVSDEVERVVTDRIRKSHGS